MTSTKPFLPPAAPPTLECARRSKSNTGIAYRRSPRPLQFSRQCLPADLHTLAFFSASRLAQKRSRCSHQTVKASVGSAQYVLEPETSVKFEKDLTVPGCAGAMDLLGTGYREKVFAIIGVKVYAAGFYAENSLTEMLSSWKGKTVAEVSEDSSLFRHIFEGSINKSLKIVLIRDVDGRTFWNALNDVISPRIKEPTAVDESALILFRSTFESRALVKGTAIYLTWDNPSKMLVSISSEGTPLAVDAVIESINVTFALFDAFFCDAPVSPTLKASVANGLVTIINTT